MIKELIICSIIIAGIIGGNNITQNYTNTSIENINSNLTELVDKINNNDEKSQIQNKKEEVVKLWENIFPKLAYYIEHDELEKFANNLENIKTYIEEEDYLETKKEINEGIYILKHIEDKYSFNLQNIF